MTEIKNVTPEELAKQLQQNPDLRLLDVRKPEQYQQGHIKQAKNVPYADIDSFDSADKKTPVYLICKSGVLSMKAATNLQARGYQTVNVLNGMNGYQGKTVK
ncbi:rhodanese-like domain-containing protein [Loigolactobacillus rennini]|nr:rhodanese-like domain-containing protein [Loigolactobacillus rennini]